MTHICVAKLTIIASDNGLSPGWRQAIIWTNAAILLIGPLGTKFNETLIEIHIFSFTKMHLKMSSVKWHPFCLGLNALRPITHQPMNCKKEWRTCLPKANVVQSIVFIMNSNNCKYKQNTYIVFLLMKRRCFEMCIVDYLVVKIMHFSKPNTLHNPYLYYIGISLSQTLKKTFPL